MAVPSVSTRYRQPPGRSRVARWATIASSAPPLWASTWRSITASSDPGPRPDPGQLPQVGLGRPRLLGHHRVAGDLALVQLERVPAVLRAFPAHDYITAARRRRWRVLQA